MQKVLKNRIITSVCALFMLICCAVLFAACGGPTTIYQADFSKADNNDFNAFDGSAVTVDTTNKTATITASAKDRGANTYFGNAETKNTEVDFSKAVVTVKVNIDSKTITEGQGFIWSVATNQKLAEGADEYAQANETMIYFLNTADGIKVAHSDLGSNAETIFAATSQSEAKVIEDGWYEIKYTYRVAEDDVVKVDISVVNEDGEAVYEKKDAAAVKPNQISDSFTVDELAGLRYGWFCYMSVDTLEVSSLSVVQ